MGDASSFALYVHVPWCRHVCPYCDFNVYASAAPPEELYTHTLTGELGLWAKRPPWAGRRLRSVYFGGGTPSLFSPAAVARVLGTARIAFGLEADAEVTLEANPGTLTQASLAGHVAAGVNRLSLGAQSFHPALLRTLGRDHTAADVGAAVHAARAAGFRNVSLDLIFAVPGETLADWQADLAAALTLAPEHVSAYGLTYEEGTPFHTRRAAGRLHPVDADAEAAMAEATAATLAEAGYERYEISSWARPGFASRHNRSYWDGSDYLGIGAGAHSFSATPAPGRRWMNARDPDAYATAVRAGEDHVATEEQLSVAQARAEFCFTGLRQTVGVDVATFAHRFGVDLRAAFPHVDDLAAEGLVEQAEGRLRLTAQGLRFADSVSATFV